MDIKRGAIVFHATDIAPRAFRIALFDFTVDIMKADQLSSTFMNPAATSLRSRSLRIPASKPVVRTPTTTVGFRRAERLNRSFSRRRFMSVSAGAAGILLSSRFFSHAKPAETVAPRPIPGGLQFLAPGDLTVFHVKAPGYPGSGLDPATNDPSLITDFNGQVGLAYVRGTGTHSALGTLPRPLTKSRCAVAGEGGREGMAPNLDSIGRFLCNQTRRVQTAPRPLCKPRVGWRCWLPAAMRELT